MIFFYPTRTKGFTIFLLVLFFPFQAASLLCYCLKSAVLFLPVFWSQIYVLLISAEENAVLRVCALSQYETWSFAVKSFFPFSLHASALRVNHWDFWYRKNSSAQCFHFAYKTEMARQHEELMSAWMRCENAHYYFPEGVLEQAVFILCSGVEMDSAHSFKSILADYAMIRDYWRV